MGEFVMPSLGADMDEGTLLEWRVAPGDHVTRGDIVAVVDTEKSSVEVEVFEEGVVGELLVEPGTTVSVGTPLATITAGAATTQEPPPSRPPTPAPPTAPAATAPPPEAWGVEHPAASSPPLSPLVRHLAEQQHVRLDEVAGTGPGGRITRHDVEGAAERGHRVRASPLARRRAAADGIDLGTVTGSGPGGAVRTRDLAGVPPVAPAPEARPAQDRGTSMRRAIAAAMERSNTEIPHYYLATTVDLGVATEWLAARNEGRPPAERVLMAALLLRATAIAAGKVRQLNGHWVDGAFRGAGEVHLGVAVSLREGGVVAPAIRDAGSLGLDALMSAVTDVVGRARQGSLRSSEVGAATITVTNLGDQGVEEVFGMIHPPQVALVGVGRVLDRPVVVDGRVEVRPTVRITLSADHRASDGRIGAKLLNQIDAALQDTARLDGPPPPKEDR